MWIIGSWRFWWRRIEGWRIGSWRCWRRRCWKETLSGLTTSSWRSVAIRIRSPRRRRSRVWQRGTWGKRSWSCKLANYLMFFMSSIKRLRGRSRRSWTCRWCRVLAGWSRRDLWIRLNESKICTTRESFRITTKITYGTPSSIFPLKLKIRVRVFTSWARFSLSRRWRRYNSRRLKWNWIFPSTITTSFKGLMTLRVTRSSPKVIKWQRLKVISTIDLRTVLGFLHVPIWYASVNVRFIPKPSWVHPWTFCRFNLRIKPIRERSGSARRFSKPITKTSLTLANNLSPKFVTKVKPLWSFT